MKLRKFKSNSERFWKKVKVGSDGDCWEWQTTSMNRGYGMFKWRDGAYQYRQRIASRVAYELHFGVDPGEMCVCHKCDNPKCCNPHHLFLGTASDNEKDKHAKGRGPDRFGERNPVHKLSDSDVESIRALWFEGLPQVAIARKFGTHQSNVSLIVRGLSRSRKCA